MDKALLDKITEEELIKCYSEREILGRTLVGHGAFGVVYKAKLKHSKIDVAMKMLSLDTYESEQEMYKKFVKEVRCLSPTVCSHYCSLVRD